MQPVLHQISALIIFSFLATPFSCSHVWIHWNCIYCWEMFVVNLFIHSFVDLFHDYFIGRYAIDASPIEGLKHRWCVGYLQDKQKPPWGVVVRPLYCWRWRGKERCRVVFIPPLKPSMPVEYESYSLKQAPLHRLSEFRESIKATPLTKTSLLQHFRRPILHQHVLCGSKKIPTACTLLIIFWKFICAPSTHKS